MSGKKYRQMRKFADETKESYDQIKKSYKLRTILDKARVSKLMRLVLDK